MELNDSTGVNEINEQASLKAAEPADHKAASPRPEMKQDGPPEGGPVQKSEAEDPSLSKQRSPSPGEMPQADGWASLAIKAKGFTDLACFETLACSHILSN